jgi:hypothetical protein
VPAFLDYTIIGPKEAADKLLVMGEKATNATPAFAAVAALLVEGHKRQFESKGAFLGTPWPADTPATQARKLTAGIEGGINVDSGAMESAAMGGTGKVEVATPSMARAGISGRIYWARFAQAGLSGRRIPPRPVVGIGASEGQEAIEMLEAFIIGRP